MLKLYSHKNMNYIKYINVRSLILSWVQDDRWITKKGVQVPMPSTNSPVKGRFQFISPQKVYVIGSYLTETCTRPHVTVDMAVVMSKVCVRFQSPPPQKHVIGSYLTDTCTRPHVTVDFAVVMPKVCVISVSPPTEGVCDRKLPDRDVY